MHAFVVYCGCMCLYSLKISDSVSNYWGGGASNRITSERTVTHCSFFTRQERGKEAGLNELRMKQTTALGSLKYLKGTLLGSKSVLFILCMHDVKMSHATQKRARRHNLD
jgi:hypothetical protein